MRKYKLDNFTKGWVAGDFDPSLIKTKDFEVAVKKYKAGDKEIRHFHKAAEEITIIVTGKYKMNGEVLGEGDIIFLGKGEPAEFECLDDGYNTVIKVPSVKGDKYII